MITNVVMCIFGLGLIASVVSIIKMQDRIDDVTTKVTMLESDVNSLFDDVEINDEDCDDADYYDFEDDAND